MQKSPSFFKPINEFELDRPSYAELEQNRFETAKNEIIYDFSNDLYKLNKDTALNEAIIICAGSINYSKRLEKACTFNEDYQFKTIFRYLEKLMKEGDISIAGLNLVSTDKYPSSGMLKLRKGNKPSYVNAKTQFLDAVKYSGINVLSAASDYNMDLGLKGLIETKDNIEKLGILQVGLEDKGYKIISANGINVGVISTTINGDQKDYLNAEGKDKYLNIYNEDKIREQISIAKHEGAEFILVYVNADGKRINNILEFNEKIGKKIADNGADYVIFTEKNTIGGFIEHETIDNRIVPVCLSLGGLTRYKSGQYEENSALVLKTKLTKKQQGGFFVETNYIPCVKYDYYKGTPMTTIPTISYFNGGSRDSNMRSVNLKLREVVGNNLKKNRQKNMTGDKFTRPQLSIEEICKILEVSMPRGIKKTVDVKKKVNLIVARKAGLKHGCVAVLEDPEDKADIYIPSIITIDAAVESKASVVIASKKYQELPTIVVENPNIAYNHLMSYIRSKYNPLTVTVTGTVGKTTTKDLIGKIFDTTYNTLCVKGNYNTGRTAGEVIQKLTTKTEAYVQEMHEASVNSSYNITKMCQADGALITNLSEGHLDQIGSMEMLISENFKIAEAMKPGGPLFLNYDNEALASQTPNCKIISYSSYNESCDYYAKSIKSLEDRIEFKIVAPDGEYDAVLFMQGVHNVNNAVGAFAVGRWARIPAEIIIGAMSRFRTSGIRQNLIHHMGYDIIIDSYSCTPVSMRTAFKSFAEMKHPGNGRKIGIVADINGLGDRSNELHREIGYDISKHTDVDMFFCYGESAEHLYNGIKENTDMVEYYNERDDFNKALSNYLKTGDLLLFKASHPVRLEETPEKIFGLKLN